MRVRSYRSGWVFAAIVLAAIIVSCAVFGSSAEAAEARPWLCRDKPVFSSNHPVRYEAVRHGGRHWRLFFMQFVPNGPHDGFTTTASDDIPVGASSAEGELGAGQFYAVALYLAQGGHWVCPRSVEDADAARDPGVISDLCFSDESSGSCRMRLIIRRQGGSVPSTSGPR